MKEPYILNCKVVRKAVTNKAWKNKGKPKDSTHTKWNFLRNPEKQQQNITHRLATPPQNPRKNIRKIAPTDSPLLPKPP
jgi:hypothetical protein